MARFQGGVRQRGSAWAYRLRHAGREYRRSGFVTEAEASLALAAERIRIGKEEALGVRIPGKVTFADFRPTFKGLLESNRSEAHVRNTLGHFDIMAERIGRRVLRDLKKADVEDLVAWLAKERGVKPATTNRYLCTLSMVLRAAMERNLCRENVALGVKKAREEQKAVPWISTEDLRRLESAIPAEYRPICVLASETGMRRGELLTLEWRDVDLSRATAVVRSENAKSKKSRPVPLSSRARECLTALLALKGPTPLRKRDLVFPAVDGFCLSKMFPRWSKAAGLQRLRFHDLRHSWASRLVRSGADLTTVMRLGGWASLSMVTKYGSHSPSDSGRRAIEAMEKAEEPGVPAKEKVG